MGTNRRGIQFLGWVSVIAGYGLALLLIRGIFTGITRGFGATRSQAFWIVLGYQAMGCGGGVSVDSDLVRVIPLFSKGFYDQADEAIGEGIRDQTFEEANRVMHSRYRNRARYAHKSPNVARALAGRWEGCGSKKCPKARD